MSGKVEQDEAEQASSPGAESDNNGSDLEEFHDAKSEKCRADEMDLEIAIEDGKLAISLFLHNQFQHSRNVLLPWCTTSMYHSMVLSWTLFLPVLLTMDQENIQKASEAAKSSVDLCSKRRRKTGIFTKHFRKPNYETFTPMEIHAELNYAESLLMQGLINVAEDETLIGFIKGGMKLKQSYHSYGICLNMLKERKVEENERHQVHFESGVHMGVGIFNLLISALPHRTLKLLEFIGLSGSKAVGLYHLEQAALLIKSMRMPITSIILIAYHTYFTYIFGSSGDIEFSERLLHPLLAKHPQGAILLLFAARIDQIRGKVEAAIKKFEMAVKSQSEWHQLHHVCYFEIMWCYGFKSDWLSASVNLGKFEDSQWSKAVYAYQQASYLCMIEDPSAQLKCEIAQIFCQVPHLRQRVAGKSIPIEKFVMKKALRFAEQGNQLCLPALELLYMFNHFPLIGKHPALIEPILRRVEAHMEKMDALEGRYKNFADDCSLCLLLQGMCYKYLNKTDLAARSFNCIFDMEKEITKDTYIVPYCKLELALLHMAEGRYGKAKTLLERAKKYKRFAMESKLHFHVHSALSEIRAHEEESKTGKKGRKLHQCISDFPPFNGCVEADSESRESENGEASLKNHSNKQHSQTQPQENFEDDSPNGSKLPESFKALQQVSSWNTDVFFDAKEC